MTVQDDTVDPLGIAGKEFGPGTGTGYRVDEYRGKGGFAFVYRGRIMRTGHPVALKILTPERATDPETRERFRREAEAAKGIKGVPAYLDWFEGRVKGAARRQPRLLCIAMEWVEGQRLTDLLRQKVGGRLSEDAAVEIAYRVADVLWRLHERGTYHTGGLVPPSVEIEWRRAFNYAAFS